MESPSKPRFYYQDGTGRDTYISINQGGNTISNFTSGSATIGTFARQSLDKINFSKSPRSP